jgi:aryl-alcohol dehydrogenase-like predicted oxidoreductase
VVSGGLGRSSNSRAWTSATAKGIGAQGADIVPIPGTKRRRYLEENIGALDVQLSPKELAEIDTILPAGAAAGSRYSAPGMRTINR